MRRIALLSVHHHISSSAACFLCSFCVNFHHRRMVILRVIFICYMLLIIFTFSAARVFLVLAYGKNLRPKMVYRLLFVVMKTKKRRKPNVGKQQNVVWHFLVLRRLSVTRIVSILTWRHSFSKRTMNIHVKMNIHVFHALSPKTWQNESHVFV